MACVNNKRPRSVNWDDQEKSIFLECIQNELEIIENKKKLTVLNKEKNNAWERIRRKMEVEGCCRDIKRMKEQWQRMKISAKKNISQFKKLRNQTGGGAPPTEVSDIEWKIKDLLPHEFSSDTSDFDSDFIENIPPSIRQSTPLPILELVDEPLKENLSEIVPSATVVALIEDAPDDYNVKRNISVIEPPSSTAECFEDEEKQIKVKPVIQKKNNDPKKIRKGTMSEYEKRLFELNEKRILQSMNHAQEMHELKIKNEKEYHAKRMKLLDNNCSG